MGRFRVVQGRHFLELAVVVVPLIAILVLQYVSSRRLAQVEVIAHQTTIASYLEAVTAQVRQLYVDVAQEALSLPGDVLAEKRFDEIRRHFGLGDTSPAKLLFAGTLDGCWCLTQYYDPATRIIGIGAEASVEAVVLRISTLLQASVLPPREEHRLRLDRTRLYVDETDPATRVVYRFVANTQGELVGFAGLVVDIDGFEREYLPAAIARAGRLLPKTVQDNLIVRAVDGEGRLVTTTHDATGQSDVLGARFDFLFRDWALSARSRHTAAAQVLEANASTTWVLMVLMSVAVLSGVLLSWCAAGRERRLARIRSAFVANASHELRTPLASIAVFGEFLRRGRVTSSDKVVEYGRQIEQESHRLRHLIDNVLDFARIESAAVEYRREEVAIEDAVMAAIAAVDAGRERDGFTILLSDPGTPLPAVCIDAQAMTQVFVNLLDNAMKYSGPSRRIRVNLSMRDDCVAVSVIDFGIGIAAEDQEHVFHEFFRAAGADGNGVAGTGLGLAIVQYVVQKHGGDIEVDSRVGRGSTFTVLVPFAESAQERERRAVDTQGARAGLRAGAGA